MNYIYTAVLEPEEDGSGYFARVPDLPGCISSGRAIDEALDNITDAMSVWLVAREDGGEPAPKATKQQDVPHGENDICTLIRCDTLQYRAETDTKAVRKMYHSRRGW